MKDNWSQLRELLFSFYKGKRKHSSEAHDFAKYCDPESRGWLVFQMYFYDGYLAGKKEAEGFESSADLWKGEEKMDHLTYMADYKGKDLEQLATDIGNLRYDCLQDFLNHLALKLASDSRADRGRDRPRLANRLWDAASLLDQAAVKVRHAWDICKPFVK